MSLAGFRISCALLPLLAWSGDAVAQAAATSPAGRASPIQASPIQASPIQASPIQAPGTSAPALSAMGSPAPGEAGASLSPEAFMHVAMNISRRAASGEAAALYDDVSSVLKARFSREAFVAELRQKLVGKVIRRDWQDVRQFAVAKSADKDADQPGQYVSVTLLAEMEHSAKEVGVRKEVIYFYREVDGRWKVTGYTVYTSVK